MIIEEKRYNKRPTRPQLDCLSQISSFLTVSNLYRGSYVIIFEKTNPDDGKILLGKIYSEIYLNLREVSKAELISLLRFESNF